MEKKVLNLLLHYITVCETDGRLLAEARTIGITYGHQQRRAGARVYDTVEALLSVRNRCAQIASPLHALDHQVDVTEAAAQHARLERLMNALVLGVISGYELHTQVEIRPAFA